MGKLEGSVAVVTGGANGLGKSIVEHFVQEGARVVIADFAYKRGERLAADLGESAVFVNTDVRKEEDIQSALSAAVETFGKLDCLCNSAGLAYPSRSIEDMVLDGFEYMMDVTVRGTFLGMKHAAPIMKKQGSGNILTIASIAGFFTGYGSHFYNTAKAAVMQLTRSVAMELGESGIRVNCICPTAVATPIWGKVCGLTREDAESKMDVIESFLADIHPIPRTCYPEDVSHAAVWLASDNAGFVNGHILVIDGGLTGGRSWSEEKQSEEKLREALGVGDPATINAEAAAKNLIRP